MKIILRPYNEMRFDCLSTISLEIPNNKITVQELKNLIYLKYKIIPSEQKLTYRICHRKLITLNDAYPLSFFFVKEDSMIFIETISKNKTNEIVNSSNSKMNINSIKVKYMNKLGCFLPDERTIQNNKKKINLLKAILKIRKTSFNSKLSPSSCISNNNVNSEDDDDDYYFVNDDYSNKNNNNKNSDKKSIKSHIIKEDISYKKKHNKSNIKIIRDFFSNDLVEKLSIYIHQNNIQKIKSFLSQYNLYMNKDINDYNNSIVKNKKLFSLSQLNTNYNTSFDSDYTSNSQLINNNICEILDKNGWNVIHYSSYFGYYEILDFILNKFNNKSNINMINYEGWNALSLAVYKQHIRCVELLIAYEGIDINYNGPMGTALHIACKKNNRKIVSLLLFKADFTIKDKNNKIAIEYTHDKNIIKLISKIVTKKIDKLDANSDSYQKLNNFINEYKHLLIIKNIPKDGKNKNYSFLNTLNNIPVKPPIVFGAIKKLEGLFNSRKKIYIEIDPIKGLLRTFKTFEDYPNNPLEIIHLTDIVQCIKADDLINHKKVGNNNYYFYVKYKNNKGINNEFAHTNTNKQFRINNKIESIKFFVNSSEMCNNLVVIINNIIKYHEYWNSAIKNLKDKKDKIIEYLCQEKFNTLKFNIDTNNYVLLDDKGKEIKINPTFFQLNKVNNENNNLDNKNNSKKKDDHNDSNKPKNQSNKNINFSSFEILEFLGSGSFGKVFKVRLKSTNEIFAMKVLKKSFLVKNKLVRYAIAECNILKKSNCPFIIKLHYSFQTPENLYMILDYCPKGDLKYQIDYSLLEEDEAKFYIAELILAIEYLHKNDILYRDLKPENILIDSEGHIKLTDFGLAKENLNNNIPNKTVCGTLQYLSPEVLNKEGATKASDIYGIGAILYHSVTGYPPFYSDDQGKMLKNIAENKMKFHEFLSDEIKDLFSKLLHKDPNKRLGINNDKKDLKDHIFFSDINWEDISKKKNRPPADMIDYIKDNNNINNSQIFTDHDYTSDNYNLKRVQNFTFIKSE